MEYIPLSLAIHVALCTLYKIQYLAIAWPLLYLSNNM
jgi:hypothetical protein